MTNKILIGIPIAAKRQVNIHWSAYLAQIIAPPGTITLMEFREGLPVDKARDALVTSAKEEGASHIFFLDDDVIIPPDVLLRLWGHYKERGWKIISGSCGMHNGAPAAKFEHEKDGKRVFTKVDKDFISSPGAVSGPGLRPGLGACLISMEVFKDLSGPPYFRFEFKGEDDNEGHCEDVNFFYDAEKAGHPVYLDRDVRCGHITTGIVTPEGTILPLVEGNIRQIFKPMKATFTV